MASENIPNTWNTRSRCRRKVKKVLQNIKGVYTTTIKKLDRSGKHAEIWPENPYRKEKKSNKTKDKVACKKSTTSNANSRGKENADPVKASCAGEKPQGSEQENGGEGASEKKKKREGQNRNNTTTAAVDIGVLSVMGNVKPSQAPVEINMSTTIQFPFDFPPCFGQQQAYMMSSNYFMSAQPESYPVLWIPANTAFEMFSAENARGCSIM